MQIYPLHNAHGCQATISAYGGTVTSLIVPDREGRMADVVLGLHRVEDYTSPVYLEANSFLGALIGRYGNRIARGRFTLAGKTYALPTNNGPNHLHGGHGFDKHVWDARPLVTPAGEALELRRVSPDGEEGYPGTLQVKAVYTLTNDNALELVCEATTDRPTIVNLTQHSYFNLRGEGDGDILDHRLMIPAGKFTPIDATSIPEGPLRDVEGTPLDFRQPTAIGARLGGDDDEQLRRGSGYDHNFALDGWRPGAPPRLVARVTEPTTGRVLEVESTEPGVQFYSGNFLDGTLVGKSGRAYAKRTGFCLECQHYPDSPNRPDFPSVELKPGEVYRSTIIYRFGVEK